jgi:hypothetical protein
MGCMHAPGKGVGALSYHLNENCSELTIHSTASSALPYRRAAPSWLNTFPEDVVEHIMKLAHTPSQIGVTQGLARHPSSALR